MIEINLLSGEPKAVKAGKISIESKYFVYSIPLAFAVLLLAQTCLLTVGIAQAIQYNSLKGKWDKLIPQREELNNLKKNYEVSTSNAKLIQELNNRRISWSQKINRLSLDLPSGIWFNELQVSRKDFILKASAVSIRKEEMSLIKKFMDTLKGDTNFMKDLSSVELSSVQKRQIGAYDAVDFILSAKLKGR